MKPLCPSPRLLPACPPSSFAITARKTSKGWAPTSKPSLMTNAGVPRTPREAATPFSRLTFSLYFPALRHWPIAFMGVLCEAAGAAARGRLQSHPGRITNRQHRFLTRISSLSYCSPRLFWHETDPDRATRSSHLPRRNPETQRRCAVTLLPDPLSDRVNNVRNRRPSRRHPDPLRVLSQNLVPNNQVVKSSRHTRNLKMAPLICDGKIRAQSHNH